MKITHLVSVDRSTPGEQRRSETVWWPLVGASFASILLLAAIGFSVPAVRGLLDTVVGFALVLFVGPFLASALHARFQGRLRTSLWIGMTPCLAMVSFVLLVSSRGIADGEEAIPLLVGGAAVVGLLVSSTGFALGTTWRRLHERAEEDG